MTQIKKKKLSVSCNCEPDCQYSRYTLSLADKTILERTSTDVYHQANDFGFYNFGTDELLGNDFTTTHWFNMGNIINACECSSVVNMN